MQQFASDYNLEKIYKSKRTNQTQILHYQKSSNSLEYGYTSVVALLCNAISSQAEKYYRETWNF